MATGSRVFRSILATLVSGGVLLSASLSSALIIDDFEYASDAERSALEQQIAYATGQESP